MRMTLADWKAFCASLGVPYAEGEVIEVTDDEALRAAIAEFGKTGGAILPAHASTNAYDLVDENAPTDHVTAHTPTATQPMCWRVMGRAGTRPSAYLAFVDDTATLGLDVELRPRQARRIAFPLLKAAATADDPPHQLELGEERRFADGRVKRLDVHTVDYCTVVRDLAWQVFGYGDDKVGGVIIEALEDAGGATLALSPDEARSMAVALVKAANAIGGGTPSGEIPQLNALTPRNNTRHNRGRRADEVCDALGSGAVSP